MLPRIYLTDAERQAAQDLLGPLRTTTRLAALHPYATHPAKEWPRDRWNALIALLDAAGIGWFVIGRNDAPLLPGRAEDLTSQTDLRTTCALLEQADWLVTGDSGPMHLACAVGTPVTALFGPTARAWGFYPRRSRGRGAGTRTELPPLLPARRQAVPQGF